MFGSLRVENVPFQIFTQTNTKQHVPDEMQNFSNRKVHFLQIWTRDHYTPILSMLICKRFLADYN